MIQPLRINKKTDNDAKLASIIKENISSSEFMSADEVNALVGKINEMVPAINVSNGGFQGPISINEKRVDTGFYIPTESGVFINADNVVVDLSQGINFVTFDGDKWEVIQVPMLADGKIEEGNLGFVNGNQVATSIFNNGNMNLYSLLVNKGKLYPFKNYYRTDFRSIQRFLKAILDVRIYSNASNYDYSIRLIAIDSPSGNRIDVSRKDKNTNTIEKFQFRTIDGNNQILRNIQELSKLKTGQIEKVKLISANNDFILEIIVDTSEFISGEYIDFLLPEWDDLSITSDCYYDLEKKHIQISDVNLRIIEDHIINKSGELVQASGKATEKLEINYNLLGYTVSGVMLANSAVLVAYYDVNNKFISFDYPSDGKQIIYENKWLNVPSDAYYVAFSFYSNYFNLKAIDYDSFASHKTYNELKIANDEKTIEILALRNNLEEIQEKISTPYNYTSIVRAADHNAKILFFEQVERQKYYEKLADQPDFEAPFYGIEWNEAHVSPDRVTRVGYHELHLTLPIQNKIKRCVIKDGVVQYYLDANNSNFKANGELARLDGTDGDVMVEIPAFFYKSSEYGDNNSAKRLDISEWGIPGYLYSPKHYLSAYECTVDRETESLVSVCTTNFNVIEKEVFIENASRYVAWDETGHSLGVHKVLDINSYVSNASRYRGNVNDADLDNQLLPSHADYARNNLGRPITSLNRRTAKKYAENGNKLIQQYDSHRALFMLIMVEYAKRNIQEPFSVKSIEGLTQGGLGFGATKYPDYAGYEKFFSPQGGTAVIPVGITNSLGNNSGEVYFLIKNCPIRSEGVKEDAIILEYGSVYMSVMSYRGVENFYGHLYKIVDGINAKISYERGSGGYFNNEYYYQSNPYLTTDTGDISMYQNLGNYRFMSSIKVIDKLIWGKNGHILPTSSNPDYRYNDFYCDCVEHVDEWNGNEWGAMKYLTYNGRAVSTELVGLLFSVIAVDLESDRFRTSDTVRLQIF